MALKKLFWGEKTKEQLERSRRQFVYDLEEVNIKLKQRLASAARVFITIFMYSTPQTVIVHLEK